jgi:phosphoesterase RecJ-like protein
MDCYERAVDALRNAKSIVIGSHINPDGDAVGSMLALGCALEYLGKRVVMYSRDSIPDTLKFLEGAERIVQEIPDEKFDAAVMVDCASKDRAGLPFKNAKVTGPAIAIDHHRIDNSDVDIPCIDESAASAGEVVLRLVEKMNVPLTPAMAMSVYCTLAVDTGFFRYSNTTERILRVAAELVAKGASPWIVAMNLEESYSVSRFRLLALSLSTLEVSKDGRYASMEVTQEMIRKTGAEIQISEEFAGIPRSIKTVMVSALFREMESGKIRVSLRSKDGIDVSAVAGKFGGGGHPFASGCTINGTMAEAKKIIRDIIEEKIRSRES